jgi:hypothetical protein
MRTRIAVRGHVRTPDLHTGGAKLFDNAARQGRDVASRVLLYGCDKDAQDFEFVSGCGHRRFPYDRPALNEEHDSKLARLVREVGSPLSSQSRATGPI